MALIEDQVVVADMYPVSSTTNPNIIEGKCVTLNSDGEVVLADATSAVVGLAGDSSETSGGHSPYAADLVISPTGESRSTSNRVSDFFNETSASGKCTVYNSGGKFHTDQYDAADSFVPGLPLFSDATGLLTIVDGGGTQVGICTVAPRDYPSGVAGTDTIDGSTTLGSYLTVVLRV